MSRSAMRLGVLLLLPLLAACAPAPTVAPVVVPETLECAPGELKAAGSTAQANAISEWIVIYQTGCPESTIDYQPVGSGAGIEQFLARQTSFAGSDSPLKEEQIADATARCQGGQPVNIPMVAGGIGLAYNLEGVDELILTPETIAGIFANEITRWNDPRLTALNPNADLPDAAIAQFHRSDSSGTTDNFTKYLEANEAWPFEAGKDWVAPGGQGAKGSDQIIASVDVTPNSIGYADLSYIDVAVNAKGAYVDNGAGPVAPTLVNAANAVAQADIVGDGNDLRLDLNFTLAEPDAYPIVFVTYEVVCMSGLEPQDNPALVKSFLTYASSEAGQNAVTEAGYVAITGDLASEVRRVVSEMDVAS